MFLSVWRSHGSHLSRQIPLYAEYEPTLLLPFLRQSTHYRLERAYAVCVERGLYREQVFILGRMGDTKQALALIMDQLGDVQQAIDFVVEHAAMAGGAGGADAEDDELVRCLFFAVLL